MEDSACGQGEQGHSAEISGGDCLRWNGGMPVLFVDTAARLAAGSPEPRRSLAVVPPYGQRRYSGEATVRLRRGSQDGLVRNGSSRGADARLFGASG
jgi:hypothetical protein